MRTHRAIVGIATSLLLLGCADEPGAGWVTEPREALDPSGGAPLVSLGESEVSDALGFATLEIDEHRAIGVGRAITALHAELATRGMDTAPVDQIDDAYVFAARSLPAYEAPAPTSGSTGAQRQAIGTPSEVKQYFDCPILAPENNVGTKCDQLVDAVVIKVKNEIEQSGPTADDALGGIQGTGESFVNDWALAAELFGVNLAGIYAKYELMAAAACDDKANAEVVSHTLGVEQGVSIVLEMREWAITEAKKCTINTDQIAEQVRTVSKSKVVKFMEEHKVCVDADLTETNQKLQQAEVWRKEGIFEGIDQQVEILRQEVFNVRRGVNCCGDTPIVEGALVPEPQQCDEGAECNLVLRDGITGRPPTWKMVEGNCVCCRTRRATHRMACKGPTSPPVFCGDNPDGSTFCQCQAIPLGSPLVLDLEDDGLELSSEMVSFDVLASGDLQRSTWVGSGEGLLVRDQDGDGRISSGAELFGNSSDCAGGRCLDGVEALRAWDAAERGGNADGVIDARDRVFSELRLWIDSDGDGASSPSELHGLADRGVRALSLDATYLDERRPEGTISSRLEVLTDQGQRSAFDVWFKLDLRSDQLSHLLPPKR